jgi:hypothetical protein
MAAWVNPASIKSRRQRGAALMVMLIILVLGLTALLVKSLSTADISNERQAKTAAALAQAKEALIGYAITYGDKAEHIGEVHGYFPCPDTDGSNGEGSSKSPTCGLQNVSQIGRLPWRTLNLPPLRDGDSECLWYAVSGTYKNNPKTGLMNWDTNGQLQAYAADGSRLDSNDNQVIAVILAPSSAQDGQDRSGSSAPTCGGNYTASAYLDNDTAHSINNADVATGKFIQGERDGLVNDRMIFITRQELWAAMRKRSDFINTLKLLAQRTAECLADYGKNNPDPDKKSLPWPAPLALSDYAVNANYNDVDGLYSGRVPYRVNTSKDDSNNTMSGENLMANNGLSCPYYAATPSTPLQRLYPWWNNWKDHLFYALSREYRPKSSDTNSCGTCVEINGSDEYAAVVMLAGSGLSGQARASVTTTNAERGVLSNFLEKRNASNHPNNGGDGNYQTEAASATFNDVLYCINTDLSVIACP